MKIAIPTVNGALCMHFGHSENFLFIEVDEKAKKILNQQSLTPPPHEPGKLPPWVKSHGATVVIAGGMGMRAQEIFRDHGIEIVTGAQGSDPTKIVLDYLQGKLETGQNACDH